MTYTLIDNPELFHRRHDWVAVLERAASWALGEGDSDFPGPYAGYGAIGWRVKFRALLEGAQP